MLSIGDNLRPGLQPAVYVVSTQKASSLTSTRTPMPPPSQHCTTGISGSVCDKPTGKAQLAFEGSKVR